MINDMKPDGLVTAYAVNTKRDRFCRTEFVTDINLGTDYDQSFDKAVRNESGLINGDRVSIGVMIGQLFGEDRLVPIARCNK